MPSKRYMTTLKVPSSFLGSLPKFSPAKSRVKKIAVKLAPNSTSTSKAGSPTPNIPDGYDRDATPSENAASGPAISNFKINSGVKEMSTAGLTMKSIAPDKYVLDKSGKPCKRWTKKPRTFKTFSGFKVTQKLWRGEVVKEKTKDKKKKEEAVKQEPPKEGTLAAVVPEVAA